MRLAATGACIHCCSWMKVTNHTSGLACTALMNAASAGAWNGLTANLQAEGAEGGRSGVRQACGCSGGRAAVGSRPTAAPGQPLARGCGGRCPRARGCRCTSSQTAPAAAPAAPPPTRRWGPAAGGERRQGRLSKASGDTALQANACSARTHHRREGHGTAVLHRPRQKLLQRELPQVAVALAAVAGAGRHPLQGGGGGVQGVQRQHAAVRATPNTERARPPPCTSAAAPRPAHPAVLRGACGP